MSSSSKLLGAVLGASKDAIMEAGRTRPPNGAVTRTLGASDSDSAASACMVMVVYSVDTDALPGNFLQGRNETRNEKKRTLFIITTSSY